MTKKSRNRRIIMRYYYIRKQTNKGLIWILKDEFETWTD